MDFGTTIQQGINSLYAEQLKAGFSRLRFMDFIEPEFSQYYLEQNFKKSRLVIGFSLIVVLMTTVISNFSGRDPNETMNYFGLFAMAPMLLCTLVLSYTEHRKVYKLLVVGSAITIGLAGTVVNLQAYAAGMSYYFAAQTGWIFIIWLVFGMQFRVAARSALVVTLTYLAAAGTSGVLPIDQLFFEGFMLVAVNLAGSYSCYQLEYSARQTYLESKLLEELAGRDGLTSLYNRRSFDQYSKRIWRQARRERDQLTFLMIDIDHFKAYNDMYGHQAGDDALRAVADIISDSVQRPLDMASRFGGEEFSLVLYGPASSYGHELPERLREKVEGLAIEHEGSEQGVLTVSVGVAIIHPGASRSLAGSIQMADEALYEAKGSGRNKVVVGESGNTNVQTGQFRVRKSA